MERDYQLHRLSAEQHSNPGKVIKEFFKENTLGEIRTFLSELLYVAMASENECFASGVERANTIFMVKKMEEMIEAVYVKKLNKENRKKEKEKQ